MGREGQILAQSYTVAFRRSQWYRPHPRVGIPFKLAIRSEGRGHIVLRLNNVVQLNNLCNDKCTHRNTSGFVLACFDHSDPRLLDNNKEFWRQAAESVWPRRCRDWQF
jgi:hypothetical protein